MDKTVFDITFKIVAGAGANAVTFQMTKSKHKYEQLLVIDGEARAAFHKVDAVPPSKGILGFGFDAFLAVGYADKKNCIIYNTDGTEVMFGSGGGATLGNGKVLVITNVDGTYRLRVQG